VDVSSPRRPVYVGNLPTRTVSSTWRGVKVFANHAFIVSEAADHGMQVFDLTQLRGVTSPPVSFRETAHYAGFGSTHTLALNTSTGFAYAVGTRTCEGGLHVVDVRRHRRARPDASASTATRTRRSVSFTPGPTAPIATVKSVSIPTKTR
jgi:choice-of-anchor B domain-containing protein